MNRFVALVWVGACVPDRGPFEVEVPSSPELDGDVARNGRVDVGGAELQVGVNAEGVGTRGFLTFDLDGLIPPDEARVVDRAVLVLHETGVTNDPFGTFGPAFLEVVDYGAELTAQDFDLPPLIDAGVAARESTPGAVGIPVELAVAAFLDSEPEALQLQIRIRFPLDDDVGPAGDADHTWRLASANPGGDPETVPVLELTTSLGE